MPKIRRNTGSSPNGVFTRTRCLVCTLTTAGVTFFSIGASEGIAWPSTALGSAATIGAATGADAARAGVCRVSRTQVAAKPPKVAAAVRAISSGAFEERRAVGSVVIVRAGRRTRPELRG
jgi:hypothetical protein